MPATPAQLDSILARITEGESQAEIARSLGVGATTLHDWLSANDSIAERSARARLSSAESWLDRGHAYLVEAERDPAEIARARALEQHCARRASIRNPAYRDKQDIAHSGTIAVSLAAELAALNK